MVTNCLRLGAVKNWQKIPHSFILEYHKSKSDWKRKCLKSPQQYNIIIFNFKYFSVISLRPCLFIHCNWNVYFSILTTFLEGGGVGNYIVPNRVIIEYYYYIKSDFKKYRDWKPTLNTNFNYIKRFSNFPPHYSPISHMHCDPKLTLIWSFTLHIYFYSFHMRGREGNNKEFYIFLKVSFPRSAALF